ncbi:PhzF family phenazine biosynthesis protein [Brachybacterium fresconis]|uniref:PhzF family phenazine biosynthesis protein n=1 Tax=Brachybacterium fresconis TaxID=173363 RepID=A0ABS4YKL4_9MICO|nr:PhzF family phenazine biosynthesis protein [Brachybacterium fresconis]MBP2409338.1 PhzF family phenazine biosynthesis protein [Brachybacterium fresconis]
MSPAAPIARRFAQLDVFADRPQRGNPLAVVLDAQGLTEEEMQRVARWTNLSETTFLLPPISTEADYRVRIFTPSGELPFAGHPTLGTARAWLEAGGIPAGERIVQECAAGLITVRRDGGRLAFAAPALLRSGPLDEADVDQLASALGVTRSSVLGHAWVDNGPGWRVLELESADQVLSLSPDLAGMTDAKLGVVGRHGSAGAAAGPADGTAGPLYEVRAFTLGGVEDPVTGSLNAGIAQWLLERGGMPTRWTVSQGTVLGRVGRIDVQVDADATIWIGGATVLTVEGSILV